MRREEIEKELFKHDSTVLSFPERGPWGDSAYRGNCSGWIIAYFLWKYNAKSLAEIFAGGGTGYDVCKDMEIAYTGIDLNPTPVREGIVPMDILDDDIPLPDGFYTADMIFAHPPYPQIQHIQYSNSMWKDTKGNLAEKDIQNMSWEEGMKAVNHAIMRGYAAMQPGAYEVVLVGDIRKKGQFHSMMSELVIPGNLEQVCVKLQHNTVSGRNWNGQGMQKKNFVPLAHEMIAVIKKPSGYELAFLLPKRYEMDIRNSRSATWKDVVAAVLHKIGGEAHLNEIYKEIDGCEKSKSNPHWQEKVRQTLQIHDMFCNKERGVWTLAA